MSEEFVSTDARHACSRGVSTMGTYARGTSLNPVEGNGHFSPHAGDVLRYINCRNANWKLVQLCRSVLRAVFDVFPFVSASLVHGVSFSFVLHERSQQ